MGKFVFETQKMKTRLSEQLEAYIQLAGLSLREISGRSGIPHQTLFNWLKGSQPRWHTALPADLQRLGLALSLADDDIALLLHLAGCNASRSELFLNQEVPMDGTYRIPKGWEITGDDPDHYEIGVDPTVSYKDQLCVTIKSKPDPICFAALAQQIKAEAYHGKRVRFSAALRSQDIENRAVLFMRVGGRNGKILAFDNMRERFISGTNDWDQHAIVLDVAEGAEDIGYGFLLALAGQVWMADVHLDIVELDVPTTDILAEIEPYFPTNLDFED
jgi:transcriptional regulator with XRE-family HTH domain